MVAGFQLVRFLLQSATCWLYVCLRQQGNKFVEVIKPEELRVDVKGDVRNEYVRPIRWTRPGVLLLEQLSIFRGGEIDDAKFQLRAGLDPTTGKFKVISKKKLPSDVKKED